MKLPIEIGIAERINKYADSRKTSVSKIAEDFFVLLTAVSKTEEQEISPLVKSFSIENITVPANFNYKTELANARNEKYLQ